MFFLLPAPVHRLLLRVAHRARIHLWRWQRREVHGCNVLAFDPAGRLLLVRHSYQHPDLWMLPGGGIARGEDPADTGRRELIEETGCRLEWANWFGTDVSQMFGWANRIELVAGETADAPRADNRELAAAEFFALDALPRNTSGSTVSRLALWHEWQREHA